MNSKAKLLSLLGYAHAQSRINGSHTRKSMQLYEVSARYYANEFRNSVHCFDRPDDCYMRDCTS